MKRFLVILTLLLFVTAVGSLSWLITTDKGLQWAFQHARPYLPDDLTIQHVKGRIIGPISLHKINYENQKLSAKIETAELDWQPMALLTGTIKLTDTSVRHVEISLFDIEDPENNTTAPSPLITPWDIQLEKTIISDIQINKGELRENIQNIRLEGSFIRGKASLKKLYLTGDDYDISARGSVHTEKQCSHELLLDWRTRLAGDEIKGRGKLAGNLDKTRLTQELTGVITGRIDVEANSLQDNPAWRGVFNGAIKNIARHNLNLPDISGELSLQGTGNFITATLTGEFTGESPDTGNLSAELSAQKLENGNIQIDKMDISIPGFETTLNTRGQWHSNTNSFAFDTTWANLRWPVIDPPRFASKQGRAQIHGNPENYLLEITSDQPLPEFPSSTWKLSAQGDLHGIQVRRLDINALNGQTIVTGHLDWSTGLKWQAVIQGTNLNPAAEWPRWPGLVDIKVTSNGGIENDKLVSDIQIQEVKGKIRGHPVSLHSKMQLQNQVLKIQALDFASGESVIQLQGQLAETLDLAWKVKSANLAELYPGAQGNIEADGKASGPISGPFIQSRFSGSELSMSDYSIKNLDGTFNLDLMHWQKIDLDLEATSLQIYSHPFDSISIKGNNRKVTATAMTMGNVSEIILLGSSVPDGWQGHVKNINIQSQESGTWALMKPTLLSLQKDTIELENTCIESSLQGKACLSLRRKHNDWQVQGELKEIPLLYLQAWLPPDTKINGKTGTSFSLQYSEPGSLQGNILVALLPGSFAHYYSEDDYDELSWRGGNLTITANKQGLQATSNININEAEQISFNLSLPGASALSIDPKNQRIQGEASISLHNLGLIESTFPEIQEIKGLLTANLATAGTLAQPRLSGQADLVNASFKIPRLGLNVTGFNIQAINEGHDRINFTMNANSGQGFLKATGHTLLDAAAGWPTELSVQGEQFEASRIPEAQVEISPDLQIKLAHQQINVDGQVHIPFAKLEPGDRSNAVQVSNDAFIIDGASSSQSKWAINTNIRLTLGDRVSVKAYGFDGVITGNILLTDTPEQVAKATGEITVTSGQYLAYGQQLQVERGRLFYTDSPVDNPGLDLQAVRVAHDVTAGLKVRGTLNQPQTELFSTPPLDQTDILSYLLLGHPIDNASSEEGAMMSKAALALGLSGGNRMAGMLEHRFGLDEMRIQSNGNGDAASLVLGRYLTPKIYISYGIGLFENMNTFNVRYKISRKWQINAESGEHHGTDLLYTISR